MKAAFMLDTNTVSDAMRGTISITSRLMQYGPPRICISSLTLAELRFGASRKKSNRIHGLIDAFIHDMQVLPFDASAAIRFGIVATALEDQGTPIGLMDVLIASHALERGATLVTRNLKHFSKVPDLNVVSWHQ